MGREREEGREWNELEWWLIDWRVWWIVLGFGWLVAFFFGGGGQRERDRDRER